VWLAHQPVAARELDGYYVYLHHTLPAEARTDIAHFNKALNDAQQHHEAVANRAFCRMDLGQWPAAIADFEESVGIYPNNDLAEFSIGECYFNPHDDAQAKARFERALALNPGSTLAQEFLVKVAARNAT
jgi:tetratricopeptide (TPR) repeat protein